MRILLKLTLSSFLIVLMSLSLVAQDSIKYSFFVAGHTYGNPASHTLGLYDQFKKRFSYIQSRKEIKFGVFTGDVVKHPSAEAWDSVDADISKLGLPVYFAVGNHDMYKRNLFEQRYGKTYYYFVYNNDLFIILDPNLEAWNISQEQLDMIKTALDENLNNIDNIFVFFHQVLWRSPDNMYSNIHTNSTEGRADTINFWTDVEPIFYGLSKNVVMYSGDVGAGSWASNFMYYHYDNITLIASGMGSGIDDNFVITNIDKNKNVSFDLISIGTDDLFSMGDIENYDIYPFSPHQDSLKFKIYPNPISTNSFEVSGASNCILDIYNTMGIKLFSSTISSNYQRFNIGFLSKGFYIFRVNSGYETKIVKVIKQ